MLKKSFLCLIIVSWLIFSGCLIKGRVVDQNGSGVAGVTVTLSGDTSMTTTTNGNGDYQFGILGNLLSAGNYNVTPSGDFTPASRNVTIIDISLNNGDAVPWPVLGVDFTCIAVYLPETGQTTCYDKNGNVTNCTDTGQDGDIQAGVDWPEPRFVDNGDGTVTDNLTGLIWLKNADCAGVMTWDNAVSYCNNLSSGSCGLADGSVAGDWRLPNIIELESLVSEEQSNPATWLNTQGFTNVQSYDYRYYWSSTTRAQLTDYAWFVVLTDGYVSDTSKTINYHVWPVRSGQNGIAMTWQTGQKTSYAGGDDGDLEKGVSWPSPRFVDNGNGTVADTLTGLIWLKDANCVGLYFWDQALNFCNNLSSGSYGLTDGSVSGDWRLPNRKELLSLIDYSQSSPAIQQGHPFINVEPDFYWSATSSAYYTGSAWIVRIFYGGYAYFNEKTSYNYVWPVRDGR